MDELREELIPIIEHMEKENIYVQVQDIVKTYDNVTASDLYYRIMRCSGIRRWKKILRLVIWKLHMVYIMFLEIMTKAIIRRNTVDMTGMIWLVNLRKTRFMWCRMI